MITPDRMHTVKRLDSIQSRTMQAYPQACKMESKQHFLISSPSTSTFSNPHSKWLAITDGM